MKKIITLAVALLLCAGLCACGSKSVSYADGTYTAESSHFENDDGTDDGNGYGIVTLTIKDNAITDCTFVTYELDGTLKDEEYGKQNGEVANKDYYNKAQRAVSSCDKYAQTLVEAGSIDEVDCISGATKNYEEFQESVKLALEQAETDG